MNPLRIQFVSRSLPIPGHAGGFTYVLNFLQFLQANGHAVEIVALDPALSWRPWYRLPRELTGMADIRVAGNCRLGQWLVRTSWAVWCRALAAKLGRRTDAAVVLPVNNGDLTLTKCEFVRDTARQGRPDIAMAHSVFLTPVLEGLQGPLKTVLAYDVHHQRATSLDSSGYQSAGLQRLSRSQEVELLQKAEVVIAIQEDEAREFRTMVPDREVLTMPMAIPTASSVASQVAGRCLYVGGNNVSSAQGLVWFIREVWPLIRAANPHTHLHVCGIVGKAIEENHPDLWQSAPRNNVTFRGRIPDLGSEYSAAEVVVIPLLSGSGLKIKLIEALAHGRAIVSTSIGVQGVAQQVAGIVEIAEEPQNFADAVTNLLRDPQTRTSCEQKARQLIADKYSPDAIYGPVIRRLGELVTAKRCSTPASLQYAR